MVVYFLGLCALLIYSFTWLLPKLISLILAKKFRITIRFGRIRLPFTLLNVEICKNGYSVHIDEIGIRSRMINSEVTKWLTISIRDIRINKDIVVKGELRPEQARELLINEITNVKRKVVDFRNKKVPTSIINFAQFMAVHVYNMSLVLRNQSEPSCGWFLHATASELHMDGSIVHNEKTLIVTAAMTEAQAKLFRNTAPVPVPPSPTTAAVLLRLSSERKPKNDRQSSKGSNCLMEFSFGIQLEMIMVAQGPIAIEKLQLIMNNSKVTIHSGFYGFVHDLQLHKRAKPKATPIGDSAEFDIDCLTPLIPRNFMVRVNDTLVTAINENSSNDFLVELKSFALNGVFSSANRYQSEDVSILEARVELSLLELYTSQEKLFFVESLQVNGNLKAETLNLYTKVSTLQVTYNHADIMAWVLRNIMNSATSGKTLSKPMAIAESSKAPKSNVVEKFLSTVIVNGCAELYNMSLVVQIAGHDNVALNLTHLKLLLDQNPKPRIVKGDDSPIYRNKLMNAVLANRHWTTELMVESLWWSMDGGQRDPSVNLKKTHVRGSPFYLGVCLLKVSSYGSAQTKLDLSLHTLRFEYNLRITNFLLDTIKCVNEYRALSGNKVRGKKKLDTNDGGRGGSSGSTEQSKLIISGSITDFSLFLFNKHETCVLLSLAEFTAARSQDMNIVKLSGIEAAIQNDPQSTEQPQVFTNVKEIRVELLSETEVCPYPQVTVHVLDDSEFLWHPNLHMHGLTLVEDVKGFRGELKKLSGQEGPTTEPVPEKPKPVKEKKPLHLEFYAEGNTILGIKMQDRHSMQIFLENFYFSLSPTKNVDASVENVFINIDDVHMGTVKDVSVQHRPEMDALTEERKVYENFQKPKNSVWVTQIGCFNFIFPYNHEFSDAIQNEFVSLFKWIKLVHNIKKKEFTIHSKLPNDMLININEFLVEMSDDPFEVKLRDNYVLLVDEFHQAEERREILEKKIAELFTDRLLIPGSKIEDLHNCLTVKNSEIYIQRSKQINEAGPTRTRLLAWIMTDMQIMAMADPSIHGTENVTRTMREIDNESPWPDEGLEFVTLWCRAVHVSCSEWKFMLRDYPQPMFLVKQMRMVGMLCGAEQMAPRRAKREVTIDVGEPFGKMTVQRSMTALKFYHDLDMEMEQCIYAFGPCWEPVMAQYNLSFEKISAPSKDPSPVLPFWDKMRLLMHGRLVMIVKQFTVLLHASLDPYNTTEEMELTWNNCDIIWTNAKIMFRGEFNVSVKTASRYDDCRLLHFPYLKLTFKLNWICLANPNDHHAVIPCAPDKLPEHSSNQVHDSFRAFRSQNLNIWISFETKGSSDGDVPTLVLYGSTLRWFESLQLILSGVTRPTRRGLVFNNIRPKKKQLSRHYKKAHLQMSLHKFQIMYWMSHALQRGFELNGGRVTFSSEHTMTISPIDDGLIHRPRSVWATVYMNCELNDSEIWLKSILTGDAKTDASSENLTADMKIVKFYFLSLAKVSYGRETKIANNEKHKDTPMHKLVVYDLKGAWTKNNRDVAFALFDSFMKSQKLKKNLGTEALKCYADGNAGGNVPNTATPLKSRRNNSISSTGTGSSAGGTGSSNSGSSGSGAGSGAAAALPSKSGGPGNSNAMLQKLIAESDHKFNVYSDDLSAQNREQQLHGLQACQDDDVMHYNWFISLVNSQVLLKGCETSGYVILSAAKAEIRQMVHRPVWRDRSIVSKTTWSGALECMQYYATVSAGHSDSLLDENIMWLTVDNIQKDKEATVINELPDLPHLVGSGQSVGGVVSETVGAVNMAPGGSHPIELQRIVSRCKCEFFYVSYGDTSIDPGTLTEVPTPPSEDSLSPWERKDDPMDAFTLMHHDLDVFTNSLQYAMIMDILNNLLLYVEPQRKEASGKLARKRFQLQLSSVEDQKRPIQHLQTEVRTLLSQMRSLEKDIHLIGKARLEEENGDTEELRREYEDRQLLIRACKEKLNVLSEELDMLLSCYKESQLSAMNKSAAIIRKDKPVTIVRANEICFKHATWRLTEADGQIGIADLILSHFLYTKNSRSDDSVEHLLELGYIRMMNLIPREIYEDVLMPTEPQKDMPVDNQRVLRVFCREKPPVGGISVKEHFEINVVPITIAITKKFYTTMLRFCFPENTSDPDGDLEDSAGSSSGKSRKAVKAKKSAKDSEFYVKIPKDDVEKMKERAEKNKLFIYIKIPELPVRVSYKGNKEKNIEDISNFSLVIPTLEYHNVTWTWLDLLLAMKSDSRRVIVSQAIKQKLQINRNKQTFAGEKPSPQEEDKARMLFGNRSSAENKSQRKGGGVFAFKKP